MGMRQYLVKWYPVYPWDELEIVDLDILNSKNLEGLSGNTGYSPYKDGVKMMFDEYVYAGRKHGLDKYGRVGYNNSWWWVVEAENAIEAACIIKEKLNEMTRDRQGDSNELQ